MPGPSTEAHWHVETKWFGLYTKRYKHRHAQVVADVPRPEQKGIQIHFILWIIPFWIEW